LLTTILFASDARRFTMKKIVGSMALLALFAAVVLAETTLATPGSGITSVNVAVGRIDGIDLKSETDTHKVKLRTKGSSDVYVVSNKIAPGGHTGWHSHPGPSLITVKSGTVTNYSGDNPMCSPQVYHAGTSFVDMGGDHTHMLRNEGSVEAETIAFQILPADAPRRIDVPNPGNCGF
jgi:quercetin dioxygenase-like cupin family protein